MGSRGIVQKERKKEVETQRPFISTPPVQWTLIPDHKITSKSPHAPSYGDRSPNIFEKEHLLGFPQQKSHMGETDQVNFQTQGAQTQSGEAGCCNVILQFIELLKHRAINIHLKGLAQWMAVQACCLGSVPRAHKEVKGKK